MKTRSPRELSRDMGPPLRGRKVTPRSGGSTPGSSIQAGKCVQAALYGLCCPLLGTHTPHIKQLKPSKNTHCRCPRAGLSGYSPPSHRLQALGGGDGVPKMEMGSWGWRWGL